MGNQAQIVFNEQAACLGVALRHAFERVALFLRAERFGKRPGARGDA